MTPKDVLEMIKEKGARAVDLRFLDFPGVWQHFTVPLSELNESSFEDGFGFDGSSIRGWQPIHASDMLVIPESCDSQGGTNDEAIPLFSSRLLRSCFPRNDRKSVI